jgi:hypothetical protein
MRRGGIFQGWSGPAGDDDDRSLPVDMEVFVMDFIAKW